MPIAPRGPCPVRLALALALACAAACSKRSATPPRPAPPADAGAARTRVAAADAGPDADADPRFPYRVAALAWEVKVHQAPSLESPMLGYLRAGAVVPAGAEPVSRDRCSGGWYAVMPEGFVCVEANVATTDVGAPIVRALTRRPDRSATLPYMYGLVRQRSAIYSRLPTHAEAIRSEYKLAPHMRHWFASKADDGAAFRAEYWMDGKAGAPPDARALWESRTTEELPPWLEGGGAPPGNLSGMIVGRRLVVGHTMEHQGFAFVDTAVNEGRRYAVTTDLLVVPVDRVRPIVGSEYHGVHIPQDIDVPFAFIRRDGAWSYELRGDRMARVARVPRRAAIKLTGKEQVVDARRYYETTDGRWLSQSHASRVDKIRLRPLTKWAQDGEHWVDVSIANQTLVAYEGTEPVYATLVSTGEAGLKDPETTKSTVLGTFRIFAKHVTTTMSSAVVGEEFELKDIPYVQYFQDGYALHAAFWHDDFGIPRSHGCVNLSPPDAKWLFDWTEPQVPRRWHGARSENRGSVVVVHP